ncbi:MAG: hypothetical protein AABZ44_01450, partial [Elusimicrobiota bacterium]
MQRKPFVPRTGRFDDADVIDLIRIANPTKTFFGWLDARVLDKLNELSQEEYLLYCFYCHVAVLDQTHQGLSDYTLQEISAALKMSEKVIIRARERLAARHNLIAYRHKGHRGSAIS